MINEQRTERDVEGSGRDIVGGTAAAFVGRKWVKSIYELRLEPEPPFELQSRSSKHAAGSLCTQWCIETAEKKKQDDFPLNIRTYLLPAPH